MSNLVIVPYFQLSRIMANQVEAALMVGATSYLVGCILLSEDNSEFSKKKLVAEVMSAGYTCWKWKMGLGPEPPVNTGVIDEIPRCKALKSR